VNEATVDIAVDNDLVLKAVAYGLAASLWPPDTRLGLLGAARYVIPTWLRRLPLARDAAQVEAEFDALLAAAEELEPDAAEIRLAAEIEAAAQEAGLPLDGGESQLSAMVMERAISWLETGDKRAIRSLESLRRRADSIERLDGKVRCLEQVVQAALVDEKFFPIISAAVCAEPAVDKALSYCFSCTQPSPVTVERVREGLESYISSLRAEAPNVLGAA